MKTKVRVTQSLLRMRNKTRKKKVKLCLKCHGYVAGSTLWRKSRLHLKSSILQPCGHNINCIKYIYYEK
ncbi:hypothetical protein AOXY_G8247 [Acipenser oxyrinchus oxyrinchus]|uniref:Uncharacterized protein n=1 Tax=Acipenser oxyrinchus oxyrinchus TaxID=40147 RepID=A0AAD8G8J8_ACIOX|nr:hypothetical protein AOXY_G8247 [Acipenser oxyrinchus oxyrinchus]